MLSVALFRPSGGSAHKNERKCGHKTSACALQLWDLAPRFSTSKHFSAAPRESPEAWLQLEIGPSLGSPLSCPSQGHKSSLSSRPLVLQPCPEEPTPAAAFQVRIGHSRCVSSDSSASLRLKRMFYDADLEPNYPNMSSTTNPAAVHSFYLILHYLN